MNEIEIYRGSAEYFTTIKPDDASVQAKRVMGENELRLVFRSDNYIDFRLNDYCTVYLEKYKVNALPTVKKVSRYLFEYNLTMQSEGFDLTKAQYLLFNQADFSLMGNADKFVDLVVSNANRISSGWTKGQVIPTEYKNISFKGENCYNALARLATEFSTEFAIEGKVIHLTQRWYDTGYTLRHGRFKGLYDITRLNVDNSSIITRLYALGSEKNLPPNYRGYANTPNRLKMPQINGIPIDFGDYIELNVGTYGVIEGSMIFEDIYPHRTGKVTSVVSGDPFRFRDTTIDFDINAQLLPGVAAKVTFNTGQLAGYTFDIESYNATTKEIKFLKNKDEKVIDIPTTTLKPAIGNLYVLTDIIMPSLYIEAAEKALKNKALEVLAISREPQVQYQLTPDPVYLEAKQQSLNIGDLIWIVDAELDISRQIRITSTLRGILNEYQYTVELSDVLTKGPITLLQNTATSQGVTVGQIVQQINVLSENNLGDLPVITDTTGYSIVYIHNTTGKLARKP